MIKVGKPGQDLRFDVPVIGRATLDVMREAGSTALAFEAGTTVVFDLDSVNDAAADTIGIYGRAGE